MGKRAVAVLAFLFSLVASAQSTPTAYRTLQFSVFAGADGTWTGLAGGHNVGVTAGGDLGFAREFFRLHPAIEIRGTYPIADGTVDSQRNVLAGLKLEKHYGRLHPYGDILVGRGQINYLNGGYASASSNYTVYTSTSSTVISPGLGLTAFVTEHWAALLDAQLQRNNTPVSSSGELWAKSVTVGALYRF